MPLTAKLPAIVVVEAAPAAMVTSTSPSVACSPSNIKPAVSADVEPSLSPTKKDNLPASSVSSTSDISPNILAKLVTSFAELYAEKIISPILSPSEEFEDDCLEKVIAGASASALALIMLKVGFPLPVPVITKSSGV